MQTTSAPEIDVVRAAFPALGRVHRGLPVAYFDGPGGTQVPAAVVDAMRAYLLDSNANTHWAYPTSEETDEIIARARRTVADFLGCQPTEVAFGANMTSLTFHLGRALGRGWQSGDEVVVTELDHHANIDPWRALERDRGIVVRSVPLIVDTGRVDDTALARAIGPRTRLVAIGAASNALGTINDVAAVARLAHAAGALVFVDAVHYAPHVLVDVARFDCDFLACSAYKFYGPHVGVLYGRESLIAGLEVPRVEPAPGEAPECLETGTQNHEGIAGAAAAIDFLAGIGGDGPRRAALGRAYAWLHQRAQSLGARLWDGLAAIPDVRLYGPRPGTPRTPTVAFTVAGHTAEEVARHLAERAVFVSHGDFYALTVIRRLGVEAEGLVRAGCACYTTEAEVDRLIDGVAELVG